MTKAKKKPLPNLIFVHVPKCAGTSVIDALAKVYKSKLWHPMEFRRTRRHVGWQWQSSLTFTEGDLSKAPSKYVRAIAGHFTWRRWGHLDWPNIVFLRNPRDRILSQYSIKGNRKAAKSFKDFMDSGPNSMSQMVGTLSRYTFVGLQEHFEESMEMLEWHLGVSFKRPFKYRNLNKAPKFVPTKKGYRYIDHSSRDDIRLYKEALRRFEQQREAYQRERRSHHARHH